LPLTSELFDTDQIPTSQEGKDRVALERVALAYKTWKERNPASGAEVWLAELYKNGPMSSRRVGTNWHDAIQFALRRLVNVEHARTKPYYYGILDAYAHPVHERFWQVVNRNFELNSVVSLNYDILVEQAMHEPGTTHRAAPQCFYGGFPYRQLVWKLTNVTTRDGEWVELGHRFQLYKLHGSVNWAWEHSRNMKMHADLRAIFRQSRRNWGAAIIPPIPEKELPPQFAQIWDQAAASLLAADIWVVCGYGMPDYDLALASFFARARLASKKLQRIVIIDPNSAKLAEKWSDPAGRVPLTTLPGLPEALDLDWFSGGPSQTVPFGGQYALFPKGAARD
jgi:hypothetical protein